MSASPHRQGPFTWSLTKVMNMRDLSQDDDFLSHLLVEKLGTGDVPLHVHKMDSTRKFPRTDKNDLLVIVQRLIMSRGTVQHATRQAVDDLLRLDAVRWYLQEYTQRQINAFATHASRYFELYHPTGSIEIAHTSRYAQHTGKSELCILATRPMQPGTVITELKGSMANLTDEEDRELKRRGLENSDIRRDFSVIHSKSMKKNHLFLGPARFVNHDCDNNCDLFREGRYITFRVIKPIAIGQEITAHYGDGYFGRKNKHCLCETCEKKGRGGYAPECPDDDDDMSDSSDDLDLSDISSEAGSEAEKVQLNLDERRTRRGVYHVSAKNDEDSDSDGVVALLSPDKKATAEGKIALAAEADGGSDLTSLPSISRSASHATTSSSALTSASPATRSSSQLSSPAPSNATKKSGSNTSTPYRSIISTRRQKALQAAEGSTASSPAKQLATPPLSEDAPVTPRKSARSASSVMTRSVETRRSSRLMNSPLLSTPSPLKSDRDKGKGREEVQVKKEEPDPPRLLRTRPSTVQMATEAIPKKPEQPRGQDGKLLPICATCHNVLPLIHVAGEVVWGQGLENQSKKKREAQNCPRCIRHFMIYRVHWPYRAPANGASLLPSPRDDHSRSGSTPSRVSVLSVLDRKLADAVSRSSARSSLPHHQGSPAERPSKRRRTEAAWSEEPANARREEEEESEEESLMVDPPKRKRGRPRLSDAQPRSPVKIEEKVDPKPFKDQPRNTNGRFDKKASASPQKSDSGSVPRRSRAERAQERERHRAMLEEQEKSERQAAAAEVEVEDIELWKLQPRRGNYRPSVLFHKPNPMNFARRAWAPAMETDESSSEDDQLPETPEDHLSPTVAVAGDADADADADVEMQDVSVVVSTAFSSLGKRPNPFTLSKRKWSAADSPSPPASSATSSDAPPPPSQERAARLASAWMDRQQQHPHMAASKAKLVPTTWSSEEEDASDFSPDTAVSLQLRMKYPAMGAPSRPADLRQNRSFSSNAPYTQPKLVLAGWEDIKM